MRKREPDPFLYVTIRKGSVESAIDADGEFEKKNGDWYRLGHLGELGEKKAETITGLGWRGIAGVASCGVRENPGGPMSISDCLTAIVSDGRLSVEVGTDGRLDIEQTIKSVVSSIRFHR